MQLTNISILFLILGSIHLLTAAGDDSPYNMVFQTNNQLAQDSLGDGTLSDPYIIEDINFNDLVGNGMLVSNTDAYLLIRDITTRNLSGGADYSLPVGIGIQGAKNIQIENYTAYSSEVLRVLDSQNIKVRSYRGKNLFFEGARESTIENCTSNRITIKGSMKTNTIFNRSFDVSRDFINTSEHCIIRNCSQVGEIDLFDVKSCMVENCNFERSGL